MRQRNRSAEKVGTNSSTSEIRVQLCRGDKSPASNRLLQCESVATVAQSRQITVAAAEQAHGQVPGRSLVPPAVHLPRDCKLGIDNKHFDSLARQGAKQHQLEQLALRRYEPSAGTA